MTKIILEGQDALNYIEMLNRIKELEALASKQQTTRYREQLAGERSETDCEIQARLCGSVTTVDLAAPNSDCSPQVSLSDAIDEEMPKQESVHRTDLPKDFVHGIEELVVKPEPTQEPVPPAKTPLEEWFDVVDSGFRYECANKHWLEYELVAIKLAVDRTSEYYHSIATLSKILGRTEDALKIKARTMGYKTKKGMIKS